MMAYGGSVPGYQVGGDTEDPGFMSGLGSFLTGAGSWEEARENPFRTAGRSALSAASFIPGVGLLGWGGRAALGLTKGARAARGLRGLGRYATGLEAKGGMRGMLGRALGAPKKKPLPPRGKYAPTKENIFKTTGPTRGNPPWRPSAPERLRGMPTQVGRRVLLRGGGGLGVAGLLALDPFDGPEPTPENTAPPPNKDLADSPAIRADRSKGFAGGGYDWVNEEGKSERDLRQLLDYNQNEGIASGDFPEDFQDRAIQEFVDRLDRRRSGYGRPGYVAPRQGYATLPEMASGGITGLGYHEGGDIPPHPELHGSGPGQHLVTNRPGSSTTSSATSAHLRAGVDYNFTDSQTEQNGQLYTVTETATLPDGTEVTGTGTSRMERMARQVARYDVMAQLARAKAGETVTVGMEPGLPQIPTAPQDPAAPQMADQPDFTSLGMIESPSMSAPPEVGAPGLPFDPLSQSPAAETLRRSPPYQAPGVDPAIADTVPQTTRSMDRDPDRAFTQEDIMAAAAGLPPTLGGHGDRPWQYGEEVPEGFKAVRGYFDDDDFQDRTPEEKRAAYESGEGSYLGDIAGIAQNIGRDIGGLGNRARVGVGSFMERAIPGAQSPVGGGEFGWDTDPLKRLILGRHGFAERGETFDEQRAAFDEFGPSGKETWRLDPMSGAEIAAQQLEGPGDTGGPGGPGESVDPINGGIAGVVGPMVEDMPGVGDGSADHAAADVSAARTRGAVAREDWLREQTPAERERDAYWDRRRQREQDNSFGLLASGVAEAISGSGGVRGNIGKGLAKATREQIEHGRLISDLEGLPVTAAAARSRASTFDTQDEILSDVYANLMARGGVDAQVAGRIKEMRMQLRETGKMSPEGLMTMQDLLDRSVLENSADSTRGITRSDANAIMEGLTGQYLVGRGLAAE
tara:strand:- start:372 stop:3113 length:2742 start_codon:yes stop_codon:yes gene_type:complete